MVILLRLQLLCALNSPLRLFFLTGWCNDLLQKSSRTGVDYSVQARSGSRTKTRSRDFPSAHWMHTIFRYSEGFEDLNSSKKLTGCSSLKTFISFRIFTIKWRLFIPQHWRRLWDPDPRSEIGKSRSVGRTCRVPKICCCFFLFRSFPVRHTRLLKISFETPVVAKYYDSSPSQVTSLWVNLCDIPEYIINLPREFVNMGESTTVVTRDCKLPFSSI